jgi:hypothetical protein
VSTSAIDHSGLFWLAIIGFPLFALGMVNPLVLRATGKEWPLKPVFSNTLLVSGFVLIIIGVVMRNG